LDLKRTSARNHSCRLEHKLGSRLKVAAIVDPDRQRAEEVLAAKRASFVLSAYKDTQVFSTLEDFVAAVVPERRYRQGFNGDMRIERLQDPFAGLTLFLSARPLPSTAPMSAVPISN
jgi:hypothetical protein